MTRETVQTKDAGKAGSVLLGKLLHEKMSMPSLLLVSPEEPLINAIRMMNVYNISQVPVVANGRVLGTVGEASVLKVLHKRLNARETAVSQVMDEPLPQLDQSADVSEAYEALLAGADGIIVLRNGYPFGVLTRTDLITFWAFETDRISYQI